MHFLLTTLKVVYVLTTPYPEEQEDETLEQIRTRTKWENGDYICRGHILNALSGSLFDVYQNMDTAKQLWDILQTKYLTEDATKELAQHLRVEEESRLLESNDHQVAQASKVHMVEDGKKTNKGKRTRKPQTNKDSKKPKGSCWHCGKPGHFKNGCRSYKKKPEASNAENKFMAVVSEEFVHEVLDMIKLDGIKDAIVGIPGVSGLSTEQRKRLTIAEELVSNPSIIFLDEPTSGLDA
ncbi:hypothetical protein MRB53_032073 [Persea americana]|uniref:Uncharacterized protein n=1 Tax=Persea americana TaxID=3435 RepID=A0ACC2KQT0_PERAE|nr:hypothetical protein MRB53_032073 [Persea americana]